MDIQVNNISVKFGRGAKRKRARRNSAAKWIDLDLNSQLFVSFVERKDAYRLYKQWMKA